MTSSISKSIMFMYLGLLLLVCTILFRLEKLSSSREERIRTVDQRFDHIDDVNGEILKQVQK